MATKEAAWVTRPHPQREQYVDEERRQRASFLATRRALMPFLVPHRFEGKNKGPGDLTRSKYGYGIGLNKSWLSDILGHVRGAPTVWNWGPLDPGGVADEEESPASPTGGVAKDLWDDATRDGVTWRNFWLRTVLEWMLSSPGGVVVVDAPSRPTTEDGEPSELNLEQARALGLRPYVKFCPWSVVDDFDTGKFGLAWIKLREAPATRDPKAETATAPGSPVRVLYELDADTAITTLSRWDPDGDPIGSPVEIGPIRDPEGQPILPVVPAVFGEHPEIRGLGIGLIADLADIVIDLFNVYSETREGFRDAAFGLTTYRGPNQKEVQALLDEGSRFIAVGDDEHAQLRRVAGTVEEVTQGINLMKLGFEAWSNAASHKVREAMEREMSGVALQAEFQLDLAPLLREVVGTLDQVETTAMFIAAQLADEQPSALEELGATRAADFRPEAEPARLARIVSDAREATIPVPAELVAEIAVRYWEAADVANLDRVLELADPEGAEGRTLRELLRERAFSEARDRDNLRRAQADFLSGDRLPEFPAP